MSEITSSSDAGGNAGRDPAPGAPSSQFPARLPSAARGKVATEFNILNAWLLFVALSIGIEILALIATVVILIPIAYLFGIGVDTFLSICKLLMIPLLLAASYFAYRLSITRTILSRRDAVRMLKHDESKVQDFLSKLE